MENNLLADIFVAQQKIDNCLAVTPPVEPTFLSTTSNVSTKGNATTSSNGVSSVPAESSDAILNTSPVKPSTTSTAPPLESLMASAFLVTVEEAVQRETGGIMGKTKYIVYGLSVRRLIDGVEHRVYHRFRDIKTLYYNLMMEFEDIEYNASIKFPNYEAKWSMSSNNQSNNPNSELVIRRRADLQKFFYELFKYYPYLLNHPRVQEFLELRSLHASSVSTFSSHLLPSTQIRGGTASSTSGNESDNKRTNHEMLMGYTEKLDSGWVYDANQGRLINQDTWKEVTSAPRSMSYVDFAKFNEWYETKARAT